LIVVVSVGLLTQAACEDPGPPATAGLILTVRSFEPGPDSDLTHVDHVTIDPSELVIKHSTAGTITIDISSLRDIIIYNDHVRERIVGQFPVPPGEISEVRIVPKSVTVTLKDGSSVDATYNPEIPSWQQSGWKWQPPDGQPWPISDGELSGVRALFHFDEVLRTHAVHDYKFDPTVPAVSFPVNPDEGKPGVYFDRLVIVFKAGVSDTRIDEINRHIGAEIIRRPRISRAYRIKFPVSMELADAYHYYFDKPEVQGILPMVVHAPLVTSEAGQEAHGDADLPPAWNIVEAAVGSVGTRSVQIALIDKGFNLAHPELRMNYAINNNELPPSVFDRNGNGFVDSADLGAIDTNGDGLADLPAMDVDGDQLITFYDLNDPQFPSSALPRDANRNGVADAEDVIFSWSDGEDDDRNGLPDDLVGWNFAGGGLTFGDNNNPSPDDTDETHGTEVAQVAVAPGDNGIKIVTSMTETGAGTAWHASIVPIRTDNSIDEFMDAAEYAEILGTPLISYSAGFTVVTEDANLDGAVNNGGLQVVSIGDFKDKLDKGRKSFMTLPWVDGVLPASRAVYTFAAGNSGVDLGQEEAFISPGEWLSTVIPNQVLLVGNAHHGVSNYADPSGPSNYGSVVEIWAPGEWNVIRGEVRDPNVLTGKFVAGTSLSAPCVAGVGALVLSRFPDLSPPELHERLLSTARPVINVFLAGEAKETMRPIVDACHAVAATPTEALQCFFK
jgi:hypothetical protein